MSTAKKALSVFYRSTRAEIFTAGKARDKRRREHTPVCDRLNEECNAAWRKKIKRGAIAQLGERLPCTQEVNGSIPFGSTIYPV